MPFFFAPSKRDDHRRAVTEHPADPCTRYEAGEPVHIPQLAAPPGLRHARTMTGFGIPGNALRDALSHPLRPSSIIGYPHDFTMSPAKISQGVEASHSCLAMSVLSDKRRGRRACLPWAQESTSQESACGVVVAEQRLPSWKINPDDFTSICVDLKAIYAMRMILGSDVPVVCAGL